jgi:hypothetical protein
MINTILLIVIAACAVFNTLRGVWPQKPAPKPKPVLPLFWPWMADYEELDEQERAGGR